MKKIISVILSICMFAGLGVVTSAEGAVKTLSVKKVALLQAVNVYQASKELDTVMSKAEFAGMIAKIAYPIGEDVSAYITSRGGVSDVSDGNENYNAIMALFSSKRLTVDKYGRFYPNDNITVDEAITIALKVMGYSANMIKNTYKTSDSGLASQKGLFNDLGVSGNQTLTCYNAYNLIYNVLLSDITDLSTKDDDRRTKINYMASKLGIYEIDGIVNAEGFVSTDPDITAVAGEVVIGNLNFINNTSETELFGLNVCGYYLESDPTDERTLLSVYKTENKNDVITIEAGNLDSFSDRTYSYYASESSTKLKTKKVPTDAIIIYNEKPLNFGEDFTDDLFLPRHGRVRLYDNDGDGAVEIVRIENYKTGYVKIANENSESIYLDFGEPSINLKGTDYIIETDAGVSVGLSYIAPNNIINYLQSIDGTFVKVIVSSQYASITLEGVQTEDDTTYITNSQGASYEVSDYAIDNCGTLEVGADYTIYFDMFGTVAIYEKVVGTGDWQFGYITKFYQDEDDDSVHYVRMYCTDDTFKNYELNKKVTINAADNTTHAYDAKDVKANINYIGLVRYKMNSLRQVNKIEIPLTYGMVPEEEDRLYMLVDTVDTDKKEDYYCRLSNNMLTYGGVAILTSSTPVFIVPVDVDAQESYRITNPVNFTDTKYAMYIYSTTKKNRNSCFAVSKDTNVSGGNISDEYPVTVTNVSYVYNADECEAQYEIEVTDRLGASQIYKMTKEDYNTVPQAYGNLNVDSEGNPKAVRLSKGDMIFCSIDGKYLDQVTVIYDTDYEVEDERGNTVVGAIPGTKYSFFSPAFPSSRMATKTYSGNNGANANAWQYYAEVVQVATGWVYSYDDGVLMITNQNPKYGFDPSKTRADGALIELLAQTMPRGANTVTKSGKNTVVSKFATSDIHPYTTYGEKCSRVVIAYRCTDIRGLEIINEE